MEKQCYEEEVQPYLKTDYTLIRIIEKDGKNKQNKSVIDNQMFTESYEIATRFNHYFVNVINLAHKIHTNIDPLSYIITNRYTLSMLYIETRSIECLILS